MQSHDTPTQPNRIAWLVWRGWYSSAEVLGVYLTEEDANRACEFLNRDNIKPKYGYDKAYIQTAWLNPIVPDVPDGYSQWWVPISADRAVSWESQLAEIDENLGEHGGVYVWARDEDHARKIGQDKIAQYKAEREGIA